MPIITKIPSPEFPQNPTCPSGAEGTVVRCDITNHTTDRETVCISYKNHDCYWIWYPKPFSFNYGYFPPINRQCCGSYDRESAPFNFALLFDPLRSDCANCGKECDTCPAFPCGDNPPGEDSATQCNALGEGTVSIGPGMHDYDQTIVTDKKLGGVYSALFPPSTQEENEEYAVWGCDLERYNRDNAGLTTYQKRVARDYFPWVWEIHQFANMRPIRPFIGGPFEVDFLGTPLQNNASHIYQPRDGGVESFLQPYVKDIRNSYYPIGGPFPEGLSGGHPLFRFFTTVLNVEYSYQTVNNLRAEPLTPGDIAIVGYQSDGLPNDSISFVPLVDLLQGNKLLFTNTGWNTQEFVGQWGTEPGKFHDVDTDHLTGSGQLMYFENSSFIPAGTIISSTDTDNSKFKWTTSGAIQSVRPDAGEYSPLLLGNTGDQLTVGQNFYINEQGGQEYLDMPLNTYESPSGGFRNQKGFVSLYNFDNTGLYESAVDQHTGSLPPGLIRGSSAVLLNSGFNSYVFNIESMGGRTLDGVWVTGGNRDEWLQKIGNPANWISSNNTNGMSSGNIIVLPSKDITGIYAQEVPQGAEHERLTGLTNDWIWSRVVPKKFILKSDGVPAFSFHSFYWSSEVSTTCLEILPVTQATPRNFSECVHNTDSSESTVIYHKCVQDVLYSELNAEQLSCRDWRQEIYNDLVLCNKWAKKRKQLYPTDSTKWWPEMELLFAKYDKIEKLKPVGSFKISGDIYWLREVGEDGALTSRRPPSMHNVAPGPAGKLPIAYTNALEQRTLQVEPEIYNLVVSPITEQALIYNIRPAENQCCDAGGGGCETSPTCCPLLEQDTLCGSPACLPCKDLVCFHDTQCCVTGTPNEFCYTLADTFFNEGITMFPHAAVTLGNTFYGENDIIPPGLACGWTPSPTSLGCTYDATGLNGDNAVLRAYRRLTRSVYFRSFPSSDSNWSWIGHGEEASSASIPQQLAKYRWLSNRILGTYMNDTGSEVAHSSIRWSHMSGVAAGGGAGQDFSWCISGVPGGPQSGDSVNIPEECGMCVGEVCDPFLGHASYSGNPHVLIGRYDSNHRLSYIRAEYFGVNGPLDPPGTCIPGAPGGKRSENCYHIICKPQYNNYCWLRHNRRNKYWSHSFTCECDGITEIDGLTYECAVLFNEETQQYGSGTTGFCCREGESMLFCNSDIATRRCSDDSIWIKGTHKIVPEAIPFDMRPLSPKATHPTDELPYCVSTPLVHSYQRWCNDNICDPTIPPATSSLTPHSSCYNHPREELECDGNHVEDCTGCNNLFLVGYGCGESTYGADSRHMYATGFPWSTKYGVRSKNTSQFIKNILGQYEVCDSTYNKKTAGIDRGACFWGLGGCKKIIPPNKDAKCKVIFGTTGACCVEGICYNMTGVDCAATGGITGGEFVSYRIKCEDIQNDCSLLCEMKRPLFVDTLSCPGLSC